MVSRVSVSPLAHREVGEAELIEQLIGRRLRPRRTAAPARRAAPARCRCGPALRWARPSISHDSLSISGISGSLNSRTLQARQRPGHRDADAHVEVGPNRQDVQARVVDRAGEDQLAALDHQLLRVGDVGAVDRRARCR